MAVLILTLSTMAAKQYELTITCQFCQKYRSTVCLQSADFERDSSITNQKSSTSVYSREPMLCSAHSLSIFVIPLFLSRTTETLISPHAPVCTSPVQVELCTPSCANPLQLWRTARAVRSSESQQFQRLLQTVVVQLAQLGVFVVLVVLDVMAGKAVRAAVLFVKQAHGTRRASTGKL